MNFAQDGGRGEKNDDIIQEGQSYDYSEFHGVGVFKMVEKMMA